MAEPIRLCQTRFPAEIPARIMQSAPRMVILAGIGEQTRGHADQGWKERQKGGEIRSKRVHAETEQISMRRSRIDFVVNWKSGCGFFFWRKAVVVIVVVIVVVLYVKRWSVFLEYLILCSFFLLFLFAICFLQEINGKLKIRGRKLKIFRYRLFFWDSYIFWIDWLLFIWSIFQNFGFFGLLINFF